MELSNNKQSYARHFSNLYPYNNNKELSNST